MTIYRVRVELRVTPEDEHDDLDKFTDDLMCELEALSADADLGGSVASGLVDVWVSVEASTNGDAVLSGTSTVRAAAHAAGGSTATWPTAED